MANENDTNWETETTEYSEEENEIQNSYEYEDDAEDDSSSENYGADEDSEDGQSLHSDKKKQMTFLLFLIIILALVGVFLIVKLISGGTANKTETPSPIPSVEVSENQDLQSDLTNSFFDESSDKTADMMSVGFNDNGEATVLDNNENSYSAATVSDAAQTESLKTDDLFEASSNNEPEKAEIALNESGSNQNAENDKNKKEEKSKDEKSLAKDANQNGRANNSIMVAWNKAVRQNPFKPPVFQQTAEEGYENMDGIQFEIIEPPTKLVPDRNIEKLLQTQISGILYDESSPSAIVNLAGRDEFVKIGDEISGYKIKNITKNKVEISYKNNTYVASVGELFIPGKLEAQSSVANLNNKFAGRYKDKNVEE